MVNKRKSKKTKKSKKKTVSLIEKQKVIRVLKPNEKVIKDDLEEEIEEEETKHMLEELRDFIAPRNSRVVSTGLEQVAPIGNLEDGIGMGVRKKEEKDEDIKYESPSENTDVYKNIETPVTERVASSRTGFKSSMDIEQRRDFTSEDLRTIRNVGVNRPDIKVNPNEKAVQDAMANLNVNYESAYDIEHNSKDIVSKAEKRKYEFKPR